MCDSAFTEHRTLKQHVKHVHKKSYALKCDLCGKSFAYEYNLVRHVKMAHEETDNTNDENSIEEEEESLDLSNDDSNDSSITENNKIESNELFTCEYCPGFWTSNLSRLNKHKKSKSHQKMKFDSEATNISDFDDNINKVSEVNDASNISKNNEIESNNELFTCEYCPGFWNSNLSRFNKHKKSKSHKKMEFNSEVDYNITVYRY